MKARFYRFVCCNRHPVRNGRLDFEKLGRTDRFQIDGGTAAITICGTTGESATLSLEEHMQAVDFCVKYVNGRVKVIAGAGSNDTCRVMLAQEANIPVQTRC
jgi:4-hydroxy-tetrahydrodipicolinate synthase